MPCAFTVILKQDEWKASFNRRQAVVQDHSSLARTAMQASMEVASFKTILEGQLGSKLTAPGLAAELVKVGLQQVSSGSNVDDDEAQEGSLTPNFVTQALNIHKNVMSQSQCVEVLMDLEARYGTRSCFHQVSKLNVLATKPSSAKSRVWVLQSIRDWVLHGLIKVTDISRAGLMGDKTHCGLVQLFEIKQKAGQ